MYRGLWCSTHLPSWHVARISWDLFLLLIIMEIPAAAEPGGIVKIKSDFLFSRDKFS